MGCGARGFGSLPSTRAVPGLPPGPLRVPARSWLTFGWALSASGLLERSVQSGKQGPVPDKRRHWRAERRLRVFGREPMACAFRRATPLGGPPLKARARFAPRQGERIARNKRHPDESRGPVYLRASGASWIPAFAGMTRNSSGGATDSVPPPGTAGGMTKLRPDPIL
jgi:hypothetical protein